MLRPSLRRLAQAVPNTSGHTNIYKAQKEWPPDFSKLHPKHQFRLERRYRRRSKLKWARPRWTKAVKLTAWGSSLCIPTSLAFMSALLTRHVVVLVYGVLFMDWGEVAGSEVTPFAGVYISWFDSIRTLLMFLKIREWVHAQTSSVWSKGSPEDDRSPELNTKHKNPLTTGK